MNLQNKKLNTTIILFLLISISFFIQDSNILYKGDTLGNIFVFFSSFFCLLLLAKYLLNNYISELINLKMIFGIILIIIDFMLISTFIGTIIFENMQAPLILIGSLFIFSIYNLIYLIISKFWKKILVSKKIELFSILNIVFIVLIYLLLINPLLTDSNDNELDSSEAKILLYISYLILILNIVYPINLMILRKKEK
jgi:hypothetical protein